MPNVWAERVKEHRVWGALESFGRILDDVLKKHPDRENDVAGLLRAKQILEFVGKRLEAADHMLTPPDVLTTTAMRFEESEADLKAYQSDSAHGHVEDMNGRLDHTLAYLGQIPIPTTPLDFTLLQTAADRYRHQMEGAVEKSRERVDQLLKIVDLAALKVETLGQKYDEEMSSLKSQAASQLQSLSAEIQAEKTRADQVISDYQTQFLNGQGTRQSDFNAITQEHTQQMANQRAAQLAEGQELHATLKAEADSILAFMNNSRSETEELLGIIGTSGIASGFQKAANLAWWSTTIWHITTVLAICSLIGWMCYSFFGLEKVPDLSWPNLAARVLVSLAFGALAAYSGFQADKYLQIQRLNSKLEMEMKAIGPYLAPLEAADQNAFRLTLASKVFGQDDILLSKLAGRSPTTVLDIFSHRDVRILLKDLAPHLAPSLPEIVRLLAEQYERRTPKDDAK